MRIKTEHVVIVGGIAAIFLLTLLAGRRPMAPDKDTREIYEKAEAGLSPASGPTGARALYLLFDSQGIPARRHERRLEFLPADLGALLMIESHAAPDTAETDAVTRWVEAGGVLLIFPSPALKEFTEAMGWSFDAGVKAPMTCEARLGSERYALKLSSQARLSSRPGILRNARAIAEDELGWAVAAGDLGSGQVIAVADPGIAENGALGQGDHAAFLVQLALGRARSRSVAFDEYHHGATGGQGLTGTVMASAAGIAVFQGLAALALFSMTRGRRLGPPRVLRDEQRRRPQEFIEAFARLCRKAGSRALAVDLVLTDARDVVAKRHGSCDAAVIRREGDRLGRGGARLAAGFEQARRAAVDPGLSAADLLRHQRLLDEVRSLAR